MAAYQAVGCMINEIAFLTALESDTQKGMRGFLKAYLGALPKPDMPFEQATLYRQMTGMEIAGDLGAEK